MANRNKLETLTYILLDQQIWHMLYILALFSYPTVIWNTADINWIRRGLLDEEPDRTYTLYSLASTTLQFELIGFFIAHLARECYSAKNAIILPADPNTANMERSDNIEPDTLQQNSTPQLPP